MQCERRSTLETYFDILGANEPPLLALIGCGCSLATEPVAEIANFHDIVHVRVHVYVVIYSNACACAYLHNDMCMHVQVPVPLSHAAFIFSMYPCEMKLLYSMYICVHTYLLCLLLYWSSLYFLTDIICIFLPKSQ